jgi:hypothetical protein
MVIVPKFTRIIIFIVRSFNWYKLYFADDTIIVVVIVVVVVVIIIIIIIMQLSYRLDNRG